MTRVHWIATLFAIAGTILVALRLPVYGFGLWVLSNPMWIWWAWRRKDWATTLLFSVYWVTAIVGFVNWLGS
jgi:hypothetical protein